MTRQPTSCRPERRADLHSREAATLDSGWRRFRNELDARLVDRFGVAFQDPGDHEPDPAVLADLALQRALMP